MENNKTNPIVVVIILIALAALAYFAFVKQDAPTEQPQAGVSKADAIKKIIAAGDSTDPIQECIVDGESYFEVMMSYRDGDNMLYDANGDLVANCGGGFRVPGTEPEVPAICAALTSCTTVYSVGPAENINTYNVQ